MVIPEKEKNKENTVQPLYKTTILSIPPKKQQLKKNKKKQKKKNTNKQTPPTPTPTHPPETIITTLHKHSHNDGGIRCGSYEFVIWHMRTLAGTSGMDK